MASHSFDGVRLVLLDIEGTICSISFVKDVLFPYALKALPNVLKDKWDDNDFRPYRNAFPEDARASPEALQSHVEDLTKRDVKVAYLKNLQGYLWQSGYESKAYATTLFPDVEPQLRHWHDAKLSLAIFSSGSVFAQKLLFQHVRTEAESESNESKDLTGLIADWFDTVNAGPKTLASSYSDIAKAMATETGDILFLSDNVKEVRAAIDAGMKSLVVDRPGNAALTDEDRKDFTVITSLKEIDIRTRQTESNSVHANESSEAKGDVDSENQAEQVQTADESKKRAAEDGPEDATEKVVKAAKVDEEASESKAAEPQE